MSDIEDHPENLVVKKQKKRRNYTPEQRERMLKNLEKARAAASRSKKKNKEYKDKKRMLAKLKKDKARKAEEEALDAEYNSILGTNQKVSMEVQEPESSSSEEEPPPRRRRRKKHKKKPRKAKKKKVKYYYETDDSETSSEEWVDERTHLYSDQPRTRHAPQRDEVLQQHYQDRMGQIAHSYAPKQPTITTGMVADMIFPPSPFGNI
mgnify:CR=1 FL=1